MERYVKVIVLFGNEKIEYLRQELVSISSHDGILVVKKHNGTVIEYHNTPFVIIGEDS